MAKLGSSILAIRNGGGVSGRVTFERSGVLAVNLMFDICE